MAECPDCRAPLSATGEKCPSCGASVARRAVRDLPSLELPAAPRSDSSSRAKKSQANEPVIELGVDLSVLRGTPARTSLAPSRATVSVAKTAPSDPAAEARRLANYGPMPRGWYETPLYAFRVFRRKRELARLAESARRIFATADKERVDALVSFAERIRPMALGLPAYERLLGLVKTAEVAEALRDRELVQQQANKSQRVTELLSRIDVVEQELTAARSRDHASEIEVTKALALLHQLEARVAAQKREALGDATPASRAGVPIGEKSK